MVRAPGATKGVAPWGQTVTANSTANRCRRGQLRQHRRCDSASRAPGLVAFSAEKRGQWTNAETTTAREKSKHWHLHLGLQ